MPTSLSLPEGLVAFFESGVDVLMATRDAGLVPDCMRVWGLQVSADRTAVTALIPAGPTERTMANFRHNGLVAIVVSQASTYQTYQVKGQVMGVRPATAVEMAAAGRYRDAFMADLALIGTPDHILAALHVPACVAVDIALKELYLQTPGPRAGEAL